MTSLLTSEHKLIEQFADVYKLHPIKIKIMSSLKFPSNDFVGIKNGKAIKGCLDLSSLLPRY